MICLNSVRVKLTVSFNVA